jgi:hypothetical protein
MLEAVDVSTNALGIGTALSAIEDFIWVLVPGLTLLAGLRAVMLFVFSFGSERKAAEARMWVRRWLVGIAVIGGYFVVKGFIIGITAGGF